MWMSLNSANDDPNTQIATYGLTDHNLTLETDTLHTKSSGNRTALLNIVDKHKKGKDFFTNSQSSSKKIQHKDLERGPATTPSEREWVKVLCTLSAHVVSVTH